MSDPTAAILVIGNEILSGRTQDTNSNTLARFLAPLGITLSEIRVVADDQPEIVAALNALRARYTYVFTTGGIGPTHDDITADAVAAAFGSKIEFHPDAMALLAARYAERGEDFNAMRQRMARVPQGASLIKNPVSVAPGFQLANVFVLAGVPSVLAAMLDDLSSRLTRGAVMHAITVTAPVAEGDIAAALAAIQSDHPAIAIGSYPYYRPEGYGVQLVARGVDPAAVEIAAAAIEALLRQVGAQPSRL
ncbi:MAG: molybdopterin-binding protein [Rhizomicrobium sp.]|nr:molybdopterin-binding protein [Rhizomicrobium sp.]